MDWKIDTGKYGRVAVKDLRAALEENKDHFLKTQSEAAGLVASARLGKGPPSDDIAGTAAHHKAVGESAAVMTQEYLASAAEVADEMKFAIDTACAAAEKWQGAGKVAVTLFGHSEEDHASGCDKRIAINIDRKG
jgi:hypothetical protein